MATSGSGTGTPITGSVYAGSAASNDPLPYTLLSLARYAKMVGINPVHFQGAVGDTVWPLNNNSCSDVWVQDSWQYSDHVSRRDLAQCIAEAEAEIASFMGYWPAPMWIAREPHRVDQFYRPEARRSSFRHASGMSNSINAKYGRIVAVGRRAVSLVGTATVAGGTLAYSDPDNDGFYERATITLPTSLSDVSEIKVYHVDQDGEQEWEIRPCRNKFISGGNVTLIFDSWLFIDPELQGAYPTDQDFEAIEVEQTTDSFVTAVDVYREYTDSTAVSSEFWWEPGPGTCSCCSGSGCYACGMTSQNGCLHVRDIEAGIVVPSAATYNSETGVWDSAYHSVCRDPDIVKIWYYAGDLSAKYLRGAEKSYDPLSEEWARIIMYLATARLERGLCSCGNAAALSDSLRTDLAQSNEDTSYNVGFDVLSNPFGTRRGEVLAWQRLSKMSTDRLYSVGVI